MTGIFDDHTRLSGALRDRSETWRFIADFAAYWQQPLRPGDGWSSEEMETAEQRLGLRVPSVLREAYLRFGRRTDLTSNHDTLLTPDELYVADGALVYRAENQGCAFWGIALEHLGIDDPGTVMRTDLADTSQERWEAWEPSLTAACVEMVMSETVQFENGFTDFMEVEAEDDEAGLRGLFTELPRVGRDVRWFAGPDVLIREVDGFCLQVRARTQEALDQLREAVPGDWLYG
ncbi:SMI1/KNR4 family protein [Streptomyces sp. NPDC051569]|uniref:SMI1/KNR4 family protein n=1 Tax=Streptomyces sp. NPDC051569 TaxID=3365661 RepID=UPI0037AB0076